MEENNSILSDIDGLNEHNLGQDGSNNYEDIEETEALVALSNAENSEGLSSVQQFSTQNPSETIHEPAFESQQTIFLKPQNAISSQSSFYEFESPIEGSFENDCKSFLLCIDNSFLTKFYVVKVYYKVSKLSFMTDLLNSWTFNTYIFITVIF